MSDAAGDAAEVIRSGALELGVSCEERDVARLGRYVELLLRWSRRVDLVAPASPAEAAERHVLDSLGVLRLLDRPEVQAEAAAWWDIGSGAGLPGLVMAIARPQLEMTLVEPRSRRVAFLEHAVGTLEVGNATVIRARSEGLAASDGPGARGRAVVSRATFGPATWLERGVELVEGGGLVLCMMANEGDPAVLERAWLVDRYRLPGRGASRVNAIVRAG